MKGSNNVNYTCPVCSHHEIDLFFETHDVPVFCNVLLSEYDEAISIPKGSINLGFCSFCKHIYNYSFNPKLLEYSPTYENSLHFSPTFQKYAEDLAKNLIQKHKLYDKNIIEIGCGKGDFLSLLCQLGNNRGLGFDPSYDSATGQADSNHKQFEIIQDYYSDKYRNCAADFICCRHTLEHISDPKDFLESLRFAIADNKNIPVFFEVPNANYTLDNVFIWDLIYEHCSYFTPFSLSYLFTQCGFQVVAVDQVFENQFICVESMLSDTKKTDIKYQFDALRSSSEIRLFKDNYSEKINFWKMRLQEFRQEHKRVIVWGAGSKGVTFLNVMKTESEIEYIIDINPRKQDKYVAGTGQKIKPLEFIKEYQPDIILVMNPNYEKEIREIVHDMQVTSEFMIV